MALRLQFLRSLSLEAKFALIAALISLPVLTAVSAGAFYFIQDRERHYEEQTLVMAADGLKLVAARFADPHALAVAMPAALESYREHQIGVAVRDAGDHDLASTLTPNVPPEVAAESVSDEAVLDWTSDMASFRVYAVDARLGNGAPVRLVLSLDEAGPASVQHAYQNVFIAVALTGVMLMVALGSLLAQRGLEPLRDLAHRTRDITASRLGDPLFNHLGSEDAPAELRELADGLNDMLRRLQESFRRLDEFSSDLAHELRTPIANLRGQSEVALLKARSVEEYRAVLESNIEELQRLSSMIHDMLFLAQSESAASALTLERVELRESADKVLEYYEPLLEEKHIRVVSSGSGSVRANRLLVQRAVANLISNAVRHAPVDSMLQISVSRAEPGWMALKVSNAGRRIAPEDLPWIFQRFFRGDAMRKDGEGWGLGLAIVKAIMDMHAGRVQVHTEEGLTAFTLSFPQADA